jgi:heme exporter protein D
MNELAMHLAMGRYAAYVWPAYGITALAFAWMAGQTLITLRARRREERELAALGRPRRVRTGAKP